MIRLRKLVLPFTIFVLAVAASAQGKSGTFVDKTNGYSFSYPTAFNVLKGKAAKSETAFGEFGSGKKLIKVTPAKIATKYHGWYEFNVWKSTATDAQCGAPTEGEQGGAIPVSPPEEGPKTIQIGGHTFNAYEGSEGGMSKSLGVFGYRAKVGSSCWQIQEMTYQVSAFDDYKPFDDKKIRREFLAFAKSFKLL